MLSSLGLFVLITDQRHHAICLRQAFSQDEDRAVVGPSKTVEGLVDGGLRAVVAGALLWWITPFTAGDSLRDALHARRDELLRLKTR